MATFRFKKTIPVSYARQGFIYFISRRYRELSAEDRKQIRQLCARAGGEYREAVLEFVTTENGAAAVCMKHNVSVSTLERAVRRYYMEFDEQL